MVETLWEKETTCYPRKRKRGREGNAPRKAYKARPFGGNLVSERGDEEAAKGKSKQKPKDARKGIGKKGVLGGNSIWPESTTYPVNKIGRERILSNHLVCGLTKKQHQGGLRNERGND